MSIHTVVSVFIWANTDLDNVECQSHIPHAVSPKRENMYISPRQEANIFWSRLICALKYTYCVLELNRSFWKSRKSVCRQTIEEQDGVNMTPVWFVDVVKQATGFAGFLDAKLIKGPCNALSYKTQNKMSLCCLTTNCSMQHLILQKSYCVSL